MIEIVYTWSDGREEVRYRRSNRDQARDLIEACHRLRGLHGDASPYSYREVPSPEPQSAEHELNTPKLVDTPQ